MTTLSGIAASISCCIVTIACCDQDTQIVGELESRSGEQSIALIRPQSRDTATEHNWLAPRSEFVLWSEMVGDSIRVNGQGVDTVLVVPMTPLEPKELVLVLNAKTEGNYTVQWLRGPVIQIEVDSSMPTVYRLVLDHNKQVIVETTELTGIRD